MRYTMIFPMAEDFQGCLFLLKPLNHRNPLFAGRWTVPGGHVEYGETEIEGAARELREETGIDVDPEKMRPVLRFLCNCDPDEEEHEIFVFGTVLPAEVLRGAVGESGEMVRFFNFLPGNSLWYLRPLLELVTGRMRQPLASK